MTKTPALRGLLAGFVLLVGSVSPAFAQGAKGAKREPPKPAEMLDPRLGPKHDESVKAPSARHLSRCFMAERPRFIEN